MTNETPDWMRLHKALAFEAENGFIDLVRQKMAL
jgi:ATP-dependent DNA helicase RecG